MYQITRTRIVEQLEIDDNGTKTVLDVDISADAILKDYNQAQYAIAQAQMLAQKAKDEKDAEAAEQAMGEAILSLFKVIFGKDQLDKILQIYDNRPLEMLGDIAPFIAEVVTPRIHEAQQRIQNSYKRVKSGKK